jgi:hypothetical protein
LQVVKSESVERVDRGSSFDVHLAAHTGKGEGWLNEDTWDDRAVLQALGACIVAELDIVEFADKRHVTNVDLMVAECVFPYLVSDLAWESKKRGLEGVGYGAAIN